MALKVELKPHERIIIGESVITNADQRTRLLIDGTAPILREKDIMHLPRRAVDVSCTRPSRASRHLLLSDARHHPSGAEYALVYRGHQ